MSAKLIQHLKDVCEQNESVKILLSQWEFDRLLVGKALENVGSYYPHFSNHNASHSNQILINIERILGDDIKRLSATDTWLLLEAAYWHDIGMLVDAKSAKSLHDNENFQFMVKRIAADNSHDLHAFAKVYVDEGWSAAIGSLGHPFDGVEKYRQLIAEWFRSKHAQRVGEITQDPFKDLGINSPRTELLPKRLYRYLGNICMAHGTSFEKMMADLPYKQTGLGLENCHPRFVACMLRLGDLFDLDDNRFCPVMQKHVHNMPELSQRHHDKHLSIREFQLDRTTVRVVAECDDEMVFVETQTWFDWIREEFQKQMSQWKFIAPEREFGLLPTLEQLDVRMSGNKILLDHKPMKFSLDEQNAIEILEGSGIYKSSTNIYRELIQNAIDATLMRVWLQHGDHSQDTLKLPKNSHPFEAKTQEILSRYPLFFDFKKIKDIDGTDEALWEFILEDKGVGISLDDLKYMQRVAGSSRNIERQKIIDKMPQWMRPSGQFGIGLHSAFLLMKNLPDDEQKITIVTKSIKDNKSYKIEMYSPISKKNGYCFIEEIPCCFSGGCGTKLIINLKTHRKGRAYYFNPSDLYRSMLKDYDPLKEESFDKLYFATQMDDILKEVFSRIFLTVDFSDFWKDKIRSCYVFDGIFPRSNEYGFWVSEYSLYVNIKPSSNFLYRAYGSVKGGFKGQDVGNISYSDHLFSFYLMFYGLDAKSTLQTNRSEWKKEFVRNFQDNEFIEELSAHIIEKYPELLREQLEAGFWVSLFKYFFCGKNSQSDQQWMDLNLFDNYNKASKFNSISFRGMLQEDSFTVKEEDSLNRIDIDQLADSDILIKQSFSRVARSLFDDFWIRNGGSVTDGKRVIEYTKNGKKMKDGEHLLIANLKNRIDGDAKRLHLDEDWISTADFKKYALLFRSSSLTAKLVGSSKKNQEIKCLILPFIIDFNAGKKSIKTDFLDSDLLIKDAWDFRDEIYQNESYETFDRLYRELADYIDDVMKDELIWTKHIVK